MHPSAGSAIGGRVGTATEEISKVTSPTVIGELSTVMDLAQLIEQRVSVIDEGVAGQVDEKTPPPTEATSLPGHIHLVVMSLQATMQRLTRIEAALGLMTKPRPEPLSPSGTVGRYP